MKKTIKGIALLMSAVALLLVACDKKSMTMSENQSELQTDLRASDYNFTAQLSGANEVPPNESDGVGVTVVKISRDESSISYRLIVSNIDSVTASHFHMAPPGENGGVVAFLYDGPLVENQNGILAEGTIEAGDVIGGLAGDLDALIMAIRDGNIYVNVHSTEYPGGEVRGQVD